MIAVPAVDLHDGCCVQLVGGDLAAERVSLPDPVAEARGWHALGFAALHVVDLDAALGRGDNLPVVRRILAATPADTQVGGGVRDDDRVGPRICDRPAERAHPVAWHRRRDGHLGQARSPRNPARFSR